MKTRILVVEDDRYISQLLRAVLVRHQFEVFSARDEAGFQKELSSNPEILLMDIMLGDRNGVDIYEETREKGLVDSKLPVIFLSASIKAIGKIRGKTGNEYTALAKPFEVSELVSTLRAALPTAASA